HGEGGGVLQLSTEAETLVCIEQADACVVEDRSPERNNRFEKQLWERDSDHMSTMNVFFWVKCTATTFSCISLYIGLEQECPPLLKQRLLKSVTLDILTNLHIALHTVAHNEIKEASLPACLDKEGKKHDRKTFQQNKLTEIDLARVIPARINSRLDYCNNLSVVLLLKNVQKVQLVQKIKNKLPMSYRKLFNSITAFSGLFQEVKEGGGKIIFVSGLQIIIMLFRRIDPKSIHSDPIGLQLKQNELNFSYSSFLQQLGNTSIYVVHRRLFQYQDVELLGIPLDLLTMAHSIEWNETATGFEVPQEIFHLGNELTLVMAIQWSCSKQSKKSIKAATAICEFIHTKCTDQVQKNFLKSVEFQFRGGSDESLGNLFTDQTIDYFVPRYISFLKKSPSQYLSQNFHDRYGKFQSIDPLKNNSVDSTSSYFHHVNNLEICQKSEAASNSPPECGRHSVVALKIYERFGTMLIIGFGKVYVSFKRKSVHPVQIYEAVKECRLLSAGMEASIKVQGQQFNFPTPIPKRAYSRNEGTNDKAESSLLGMSPMNLGFLKFVPSKGNSYLEAGHKFLHQMSLNM
ncbi:hypothetical protein L345_08751, partial [Ophiophagus hannah]